MASGLNEQDLGEEAAKFGGRRQEQSLCWERLRPFDSVSRPILRSHHQVVRLPARGSSGDQTLLLLSGDAAPGRRALELSPLTICVASHPDDVQQLNNGRFAPERLEWQLPRATMPSQLRDCTVVALRDVLVVFGGLHCAPGGLHEASGELLLFDVPRSKWLTPKMPGGQTLAAIALAKKEDHPEPRFEHCAAALGGTAGRSMLVHGGRNSKNGRPMESLFSLTLGLGPSTSIFWHRLHLDASGHRGSQRDHAQVVQTQMRKRSLARRAHSIALTTTPDGQDRALLFGGRCEDGDEGRLCSTLTIIEVSGRAFRVATDQPRGRPPEPRAYHSAVILGQFMAVFGGLSRSSVPLCDVHLLHIESLVWARVTSPNVIAGVMFTALSGCDAEEGAVEWPCGRWAHAAVAIDRPAARGGVAMLIFGGVNALGDQLDDMYCLSFVKPVVSSGAGAGPAVEAMGTYPDAMMLSLWDRLFGNLQVLGQHHGRALHSLQGESTDREDFLLERENRLAGEDRNVYMAEMSLRDTVAREAQVRGELEAKRRSNALAIADSQAQIQEAEVQAETLRQQVARLQGVQSLLGASRQFPTSDVSASEQDQPAQDTVARPFAESALLEVSRRAGTWRGVQVTVEEVPLPILQRHARENTDDSRSSGVARSGRAVLQHRRTNTEDFGRIDSEGRSGRLSRSREKAKDASVKDGRSGPTLTAHAVEEVTRRELQMAVRLRHPNLIEYFGMAPSSNQLLVVAEPPLVPVVLELQLGHDRRLQEPAVRLRLALDVALALEYLHTAGVAHRRVGPEQVFLRDAPHPTAKLGGLVSSRVRHSAARQGIRDEPTDPRPADVLAYGSMLAQLVGVEGLAADAARGKRSSAVRKIDNGALRLVAMKCMEKDARHRMSASMVARAMRCIERGDAVVRIDNIPGDASRYAPLVDSTRVMADVVEGPA